MSLPMYTGPDRRQHDRAKDPLAAHHDAVFMLARASELFDEDTGAHLMRIRTLVSLIARAMGFDDDDATRLGIDAMLHDVGKLNIPEDILKKRGLLTDAERTVMQSHTTRGERLLSTRPSMKRAARIARSHHERFDGSGYPDGLVGEAIPLEARITAVADILDALIATRCYKQAWTYEQAIAEVYGLAGTHLDPQCVEAMRSCDRSGELCSVFGIADRCVAFKADDAA